MSTPGSPRKPPPASPARGHKRKASEVSDHAGPSASPNPGRRNSRQLRTFQIAQDFDQDAPYDQDLDADGEYDEEWMEEDAEGEDEDIGLTEVKATEESEAEQVEEAMMARREPSSVRPKRANAPSVSYYDIPPLPPSDDGQDDEEEEQLPVIKKRGRGRPSKHPLPTSDIEMDQVPAKSSGRANPMGKTPRRPPAVISDHDPSPSNSGRQRSAKPEEPEMTEKQKAAARAEKEAEDLRSRWTEEYFEIVEQLPLEVHRTFALMRELEGQMQTRLNGMIQNMVSYRDARIALQRTIDEPSSRAARERKGSEDEAENLLGGSQTESNDIVAVEAGGEVALGKAERRELLGSIANAANESVKAAEEKMGLAATAYNWIDRHIRRLDADIGKLESSILLGLRTGTEESRGAREALGLPVDDDAGDDAQEAEQGDAKPVSAEAESASLTKAAGAANPSTRESARKGGRRSTTTTPKMGGQTQLPPASPAADSKRSRSRSRSAASTATADRPHTTHRLNRKPTRSPSPTTPATRTSRKRKPKPLSPQKGGRRSIVTPQITSPSSSAVALPVVGPDTSEMPFDPTEPTYCYCDQISFDDMVACENEDCTIEWFHFACVGLSSQPKAEWYCRFCAPPGWKGPGMGVPANAKHRPPGWKKGIGIKP